MTPIIASTTTLDSWHYFYYPQQLLILFVPLKLLLQIILSALIKTEIHIRFQASSKINIQIKEL